MKMSEKPRRAACMAGQRSMSCVCSPWIGGDKEAHPGERGLNPHEKKKRKEVPAVRVRQ